MIFRSGRRSNWGWPCGCGNMRFMRMMRMAMPNSNAIFGNAKIKRRAHQTCGQAWEQSELPLCLLCRINLRRVGPVSVLSGAEKNCNCEWRTGWWQGQSPSKGQIPKACGQRLLSSSTLHTHRLKFILCLVCLIFEN